MKKRSLSLAIAVCMICCLTMTSCSAAEVPENNSGAVMEDTALVSETQGGSSFDDVPPMAHGMLMQSTIASSTVS